MLARSGSRIIDMHCHCVGIGAGGSGCFVSSVMQSSWKYRFYLRGLGLTEDEVRSHGDQATIQRIAEQVGHSNRVDGAVVLALDAAFDEEGKMDSQHTLIYIPNEFVVRETAKYDHLYLGASVNPYRQDALRRLEWCKKKGARLLKWLPAIQRIDPSEARLEPFYKKLIDLDLPLLSHAGDERSFTHAANEFSDPMRLRVPLQLGVKIIAAHAGSSGKNEGQDNMERTLTLMDEFSNLWADVSALTQINRKRFLYRLLRTPRVHERLLYGTDYPLINMAVVSAYYYPMGLSWKQIRSIAKIQNPWDRDVALKEALGIPREVFCNSAEFLGIH
jgi:predicted TIM-barrel fold metal-dependent hydrolase